MPPATPAADNTRAALLMVGSMAFFAVEDLFLKRSAEALPPGQVLALTGAAGACVFWGLAAGQRQPVLTMEALRGMALVRTLAEAAAAMLYIVALALAPLTMTSALLQASPLAVVAGAALFLGETVGWRRWASILVGFAGVLVILEPWDAAFDPTGLLTVACVVVLAARDLGATHPQIIRKVLIPSAIPAIFAGARLGLGVSIISTPKGVMADHTAREQNVGGEILCRIL